MTDCHAASDGEEGSSDDDGASVLEVVVVLLVVGSVEEDPGHNMIDHETRGPCVYMPLPLGFSDYDN